MPSPTPPPPDPATPASARTGPAPAPPPDPIRRANRTISRRTALGLAGVGAAATAVGGTGLWRRLVDRSLAEPAGPGPSPASPPPANGGEIPVEQRVLVVVQLSGGNDGLNTLVPIGDGRYSDARPTLRLAEQDLVKLDGTDHYGLNAALTSLQSDWNRGTLAAVDGVGLPGQTRSHFAASDAWWSAEPGRPGRTGWIGRWLDRAGILDQPLRALALGGATRALAAERAMSTVVQDPATFRLRVGTGEDPEAVRRAFLATAAPVNGDPDVAAAQAAIPASFEAVDRLADAATEHASVSGGTRTPATDLMHTAAGIIGLNLGTQVLVLTVGSFDTHSDQARRHTALWTDLAEGLHELLAGLAAHGQGERVLILTTSEFGRRVQENGSGTDHGQGGVQFLAGPMVTGGQVIGQADLGSLDDGDLRSVIDTRSLYANALDWITGDPAVADDVLGGTYDRLGLLRT